MDRVRGSDSPRRVRRVAEIGVVIAYAVSIALFVLRLLLSDLPVRYGIAGAVSLAVVAAVPPTLALLALRGRTALFLPAASIALLQLPISSLLGLFLILVVFAWFWAYLVLRNRLGFVRTVSAVLVVGVLWIGAASALFVHVDPICVEWLEDGTFRSVDAGDQGFTSGWLWDQPNTSSGSSRVSADVVSGACTSDIVTPMEAALSLVLSLTAVGAGSAIVTLESTGS